MIVKAPEQRFPNAPAGSFSAVCVDEIDLGIVKDKWHEDGRQMVRLVWQIDEEMDDETATKFEMPQGSRYVVKKDYTPSLHEKANLRKDLEVWRGRQFTFDELVGFDLENIIGQACMVSVVHTTGNKGGTFANVGGIVKLPKGMQAIKSEGYVRVKDRTAKPAQRPNPTRAAQPVEETPPSYDNYEITDDDVPF